MAYQIVKALSKPIASHFNRFEGNHFPLRKTFPVQTTLEYGGYRQFEFFLHIAAQS